MSKWRSALVGTKNYRVMRERVNVIDSRHFGQQANIRSSHTNCCLLLLLITFESFSPLQIIVYERLFHDCAQPKQQSVQHKTLTVQLQHSLSSLHNSSFPYNYMKNRYTLTLVHKKSPGFPTTRTHSEVYIPFNLFISHPRGVESPAAANQRAPLPLSQWQAGFM